MLKNKHWIKADFAAGGNGAQRTLRRPAMQEQGVSKILTINLNDMAKELKIQ